jgi:hypothetical protein
MAPEHIIKIDPTGGGDFLTLDAAVEALKLAGDLNLPARNVVEVFEVYGGGSVRGIQFQTIDGWSVDSTRFPWVRAATGHSHGGKYDISKAYLADDTVNRPATFYSDGVGWIRIGPGLILEATLTPSQFFSEYMSPHILNVPAGQPVLIDGCIIRRSAGWSAVGACSIYQSTTECTMIVQNSVILHDVVGDGNWYPAVTVFQGKGHLKLYNCVVIAGNDQGFAAGVCVGSIAPMVNPWSIVTENCYLHDYGGPGAACYGVGVTQGTKDATSTAEATDPALRGIPYSVANFIDPTQLSEDWHLDPASVLIGAGVDLTAQGVTKDFEGNPRSAPFDIGADQTSSAQKGRSFFIFGL